MNTRLHLRPPHAHAAPAENHQRRSTTTQTWDQCRHGSHIACLPKTSPGGKPTPDDGPTADELTNAATPATEAHGGPCQPACTTTAGDRP
jgi:hypothetical protein